MPVFQCRLAEVPGGSNHGRRQGHAGAQGCVDADEEVGTCGGAEAEGGGCGGSKAQDGMEAAGAAWELHGGPMDVVITDLFDHRCGAVGWGAGGKALGHLQLQVAISQAKHIAD